MTNRENNFDLVRLFGALVVVFGHSVAHFGLTDATPDAVMWLHRQFPGVEIFFVVSGYLITASLLRSQSLIDYARKRVLRIYPALWACFGVTLVLLGVAGELTPDFLGSTFAPWVVAQLTFVQVFNPDALRSFGVGVVNGSLWTIPVELGFYVLLPVLLIITRRLPRGGTLLIVAVTVLSAGLRVWSDSGDSFPQKLAGITPAPHLWIFLLGSLAYRFRDAVLPLVRGRFVPWLVGYLLLAIVLPESLALLRYPVLAGLVLAAAHTAPRLSRVLRGHDLSYGAYIYHMLVVNLLLWLGYSGSYWLVLATTVLTVLVAMLSWRLVEAPALRRKERKAEIGTIPQLTPVSQ